jgi:hypothetical protein
MNETSPLQYPIWPVGKVVRHVLPTAAAFYGVLRTVGMPKYAFAASTHPDECCDDVPLLRDEWVMGDDLDATLREVFGWNQRQCKILCQEPTAEDLAKWGDDLEETWLVTNLPESLYDMHCWNPGIEGYLQSQDELRRGFFEEIMHWPGAIGLSCLEETDFDSYLQDWAEDDDQKANPAKYRAKKVFGVIENYSGTSVGFKPMVYNIGGAAYGRICATVLTRANLRVDDLVGMTCVWNGLGEVEWIGSSDLRKLQGIQP